MSRRMKWFLIGLNFLAGLMNVSAIIVNVLMDNITWMTWASGLCAALSFSVAVYFTVKWNMWRRNA